MSTVCLLGFSGIDYLLTEFNKIISPTKSRKNKSTKEIIQRSEQRKNKLGYDPVQKEYFKEYSKKRNGVKHHLDR